MFLLTCPECDQTVPPKFDLCPYDYEHTEEGICLGILLNCDNERREQAEQEAADERED